MARWQPRVSPDTEAELGALGPYTAPQGGFRLWDPAPGFAWPWGTANLGFGVPPRRAGDADYRRPVDVWRQVCGRQAAVRDVIRDAIRDSWERVAWNRAGAAEFPADQVRGGHFALATDGPGRVSVEAYVSVGWDEEQGVRVDLGAAGDGGAWSFP